MQTMYDAFKTIIHLTARYAAPAPHVHLAQSVLPSKRLCGHGSFRLGRSRHESVLMFTLVAAPSTPPLGCEESTELLSFAGDCFRSMRRHSGAIPRPYRELKHGVWGRASPPQKFRKWLLPLHASPPMPPLPQSHTARSAFYDRRDTNRQMPQHLVVSATLSRRKSALIV